MITFAEGSYAIRIPAFQNDEHTIWHVDQNEMIEVIYSIIEITKKTIDFVRLHKGEKQHSTGHFATDSAIPMDVWTIVPSITWRNGKTITKDADGKWWKSQTERAHENEINRLTVMIEQKLDSN